MLSAEQALSKCVKEGRREIGNEIDPILQTLWGLDVPGNGGLSGYSKSPLSLEPQRIRVGSKLAGLLLREGQNSSVVTQQHGGKTAMKIQIRTLLCCWLLFTSPDAPSPPLPRAGESQGDGVSGGGGEDRHRRYFLF